jgi:hypothetical protein
LNSEVIYSGKDSICRKDKRPKDGGGQTKKKTSGEKNVSTKVFRVFAIGFSGFVLV